MTSFNPRKIVAVAACIAVAPMLAACGVGPDKSREDAHDTTNIDKSPPQAVGFNNHYPNVETKCDGHGHRIFVTTSKSVIILPDPSCPGYESRTPLGQSVIGQ